MPWFNLLTAAQTKLKDLYNEAMALTSSPTPWTTHDSNIVLHECLSAPTKYRPALPDELVLQILNHPTRWICTFAHKFPNHDLLENRPFRVAAQRHQPRIQVILSTPPLTNSDILKLRSIVFTMKSKDQGWSSYPADKGSFRNSWSWFEAGLRSDSSADNDDDNNTAKSMRDYADANTVVGRCKHKQKPPSEYESSYRRFEIQRNRHSGEVPEAYRVELDRDHALFDHLKEGDVIDLLACAQYAGWENQVHAAGIEIWSFDDLNAS